MSQPFQILVVPGQRAPIYRQIVDQVRIAVATKILQAGDRLPSVRALAQELVVNPNTVAKAYAELVREGVLESQPGRGMTVAEKRTVYTVKERRRRFEVALQAFVHEAVCLDIAETEIQEAVAEALAQLNRQQEK